MTGPNVRAIGARIALNVGARKFTRWITAGISFLGQEPAEAFFGLADSSIVNRIEIDWPNGDRTQYENVAVNQVFSPTYSMMVSNGFED